MGYGEFTRAAARPTASAAERAPETEPGLAALPAGGTSPQVTRPGRKSALPPLPPKAGLGIWAPGSALSHVEAIIANPRRRRH